MHFSSCGDSRKDRGFWWCRSKVSDAWNKRSVAAYADLALLTCLTAAPPPTFARFGSSLRTDDTGVDGYTGQQ